MVEMCDQTKKKRMNITNFEDWLVGRETVVNLKTGKKYTWYAEEEDIEALRKKVEEAKEKNMRRMIQFAEVFQDKQILVSLARQLC
nr:hypothetical protein BSM_21900 [uncultured archaeon]